MSEIEFHLVIAVSSLNGRDIIFYNHTNLKNQMNKIEFHLIIAFSRSNKRKNIWYFKNGLKE